MKEFLLSVVTPERSILKETSVESVVLPGGAGQLNILPGHTDLVTSLRYGAFGYRIGGEWQVAFLSGGFAEVFNNKVTVLGETVEMAQELNVAKAELDLNNTTAQLKTAKAGSPEYTEILEKIALEQARLRAAQKKLH